MGLKGATLSEPARGRLLMLAEDFSDIGGVRTRVLGELSVLSGVFDTEVVAKLRAKNLRLSGRMKGDTVGPISPSKVKAVVMLPHGNLPLLREIVLALDCLMLALVGGLAIIRSRPGSLYAHNLDCGIAAVTLGRAFGLPVTLDLHGDEVEENVAATGWSRNGLRFRLWTAVQRAVLRGCTRVVCVSRAHERFVRERYAFSGRVTVIPCCVDEPPEGQMRSPPPLADVLGMGKSGRIWLFYSGSSASWQMIDKMAQLYKAVQSKEKECNMLLLISDQDGIRSVRRLFESTPEGRVRIESVKHEVVLQMASLATVGLLFREDAPLNNISSPTKFAEYLMAGLPVLITPGVGDYSDIVRSFGLGKVIEIDDISDSEKSASMVREILNDEALRDRCREFVRENLTWRVYRDALLEAAAPRS